MLTRVKAHSTATPTPTPTPTPRPTPTPPLQLLLRQLLQRRQRLHQHQPQRPRSPERQQLRQHLRLHLPLPLLQPQRLPPTPAQRQLLQRRQRGGHRQPRHRTRSSHGDVAAQRQGARRRRLQRQQRLSRERGTLRSGERDLDGDRQPRHRTLFITRRRCCPTARCSSQADLDDSGTLASAELYDPASGTWTATGSLATARYDHTATLLPNGKVLVAGGYNDSSRRSRERGTLRSGERDLDGDRQPRHRTLCSHGDVAAQRQGARRRRSWHQRLLSRARNSTIRRAGPGRRPAASPPHATVTRRRCCPTARCSSQEVDDGSVDLASAELYDPASGTWTATGSLATARVCHTATLLPNGKVLVAGGVTTAASLSRARNSTIRRAGLGRPPAASPPHAMITRRRCCPTARCSSQAVTTAALSRARNSTHANA